MKTWAAPFSPLRFAVIVLLLVSTGLPLRSAAFSAPVGLEEYPPDALAVVGVTPNTAPNDMDTTITITGMGFWVVLEEEEIVEEPLVTLGGRELGAVTFIDGMTLTAVVPWGFDPGVYPLTVENPDGISASLPEAFTVTAGINVWTSGGPYGGWVSDLIINPENPWTMYATMGAMFSATGVGLFRSLDGGEHWDLIFKDMINSRHAVAMSMPAPNTLYAHQNGKGLFRSDNGGSSWIQLPFSQSVHGNYRIYPHPTNAQVLFVAGEDNLFYSANRGQSWTTRISGMSSSDHAVTVVAFDPSNPDIVYAGTAAGTVYRSTDGGAAWISTGKVDDYIGVLAVDPFGDHAVWASGADDSGHWGYLWKHQDGEWTQVLFGYSDNRMVNDIVFDPDTPGTVRLGVHDGLVSTNGGVNWTVFGPPTNYGVTIIALDPLYKWIMYLGHGGSGISRTNDRGATWTEANEGLTGIYPTGMALHPDEPAVVYALAHNLGLFKTNNGGGSWARLSPTGSGAFTPVVDPFNSRRVLVTHGGMVAISEDGGENWLNVPVPVPATYDCCRVTLTALISTRQQGYWLAGAHVFDPSSTSIGAIAGLIYRSKDNGLTWEAVELSLEMAPPGTLAVDPGNPSIIFAGTGDIYSGSGVWKSINGGRTWYPAGLAGLGVISIAYDPHNLQKLYASTRDSHWERFYVSTDNGKEWTLLNTGNGGSDHLLVLPTNPVVLYRYGYNGVLRSNNGGASWQAAAGSLGKSKVGAMTAAIVDDRVILYVGTAGSSSASSAANISTVGDYLPLATESEFKAGVYRQTSIAQNKHVYLPVIRR